MVGGIAGYGNCFGVPNLAGETKFEACYSGNPLVNAFALGMVKKDEIFYAKATGVGNPVIYVGAKTGRDGIHGATMASEEFTEGSEAKRPNVQMGDPFMEKLLLEACLEAMATGAVVGIQDMGAAGLTCSTCEMGARGELGLTIELDLVPQRATGMTAYEIMLSESQERMLLVADKGREGEVLAVFAKWGLDASIVGIVTADDTMRVTHHGELVAEIPNKALTDEAPVYNRPVGTWKSPVPMDPPAWVVEELKKPRDYTADLKKLLACANICDKRWVFEQYDSMVQTNTVQGPGGEAGVMRIKTVVSCRLQCELRRTRGSHATDNHNCKSRNAGWRWRWRGMGGGASWTRSWARCMRWRRRRARWLYGRDSGGGDELLELRQPGEAGDHGAVFGDDRWDRGGVHGAGYADYGRECFVLQRDAGRGDLSDAGDWDGGDSGRCEQGGAERVSESGRRVLLLAIDCGPRLEAMSRSESLDLRILRRAEFGDACGATPPVLNLRQRRHCTIAVLQRLARAA